MLPLVRDHLDDICVLCKRHGVKSLALFGSAVTSELRRDESDLDFLVEFESMPPAERARRFFALEADLRSLFGVQIDLGEPEGIRNRRIRTAIERTSIPLYAAA